MRKYNLTLKMHFFIISLITLIFNIPVFFKTFLTDMVTYEIIGQKLAHGYIMYRDAVDSKPPLIYYTYAAANYISGHYAVIIVKFITITAIILSAILVYYITRSLFEHNTALAALYIFIFTMHCGIAEEILSSNTEIFMNLFILAGLFFFTKNKFNTSRLDLFLSGLFVGIAFLFRYQAGLITLVIGLMLLLQYRITAKFFKSALISAAGFILPFFFISIYFMANGAFKDFIFWSLTYNFFYIQTGAEESDLMLNIFKILGTAGQQILVIVMSGLFIGTVLRKRMFTPEVLFIILLSIVSLVSWGIGSRYYLHYFIQAVPFLAISSAIFIMIPKHYKTSLFFGSLLVIMTVSFWGYNLVRYSAYYTEKDIYPLVTKFIQEKTKPEEKIFLWSTQKRIYYNSDRLFATRFVHTNYQTGKIWGTIHNTDEATPEMNKKFVVSESWGMLFEDLEKEKPKLIIDNPATSNFSVRNYAAMTAYTNKYYTPVMVGDRYIFVRKD